MSFQSLNEFNKEVAERRYGGKIKKVRPVYTTIIHRTRIKFGLTVNEYCVADSIYKLSHSKGWCYASKEYLGKTLGLSKQSIHTILNTLLKKGFVEKEEETKN